MTMERAAEEAGASLWEMIDYVRGQKIPVQYSLEDLKHDIEVISQGLDRNPVGRNRPSSPRMILFPRSAVTGGATAGTQDSVRVFLRIRLDTAIADVRLLC